MPISSESGVSEPVRFRQEYELRNYSGEAVGRKKAVSTLDTRRTKASVVYPSEERL